MVVLHVVPFLTVGGVELHLLTLCRFLKLAGHTPVVVTLRGEYDDGARSLRADFDLSGVPVHDLKSAGYWDLSSVLKLSALVRELCPDLLHTHLPRSDWVMALSRLAGRRVPWICSVHAIYSKTWSGKWTLPLFKSVWRRADAVIAISHAVRDWLVNEQRMQAEKVRVIHYGIDSAPFVSPKEDLRKLWGLEDRVLLGSVGRLEPGKRHECLITAMPAILEKVPRACLLIAGHDPRAHGRKLEALIERLGLNGHVRLLNFQEDISSFLKALDLFVFPSVSEGFGQAVIEAMAAGRPVVASAIPPLTEIVLTGETGVLVEPDNPQAFADASSWLFAHPEEARRMGERGRERVYSHFNAEKMAAETLSLYHQLTS